MREPVLFIVLLLFTATFLSFFCIAEEEYDALTPVYKDLQAGNFTEARRALMSLQQAGNAEASRLLGCLYLNGDGVKQDIEKGRTFFRQASSKGNAKAAFQLALTYQGGNNAEYVRWMETAAKRGHLIAAQQIGLAYFNGDGVEHNDILAYKWLFSIQLRTPVAVDTWTKPLEVLNSRMEETDKENAKVMAWNLVYLKLKTGFYQKEFEYNNPGFKGPIKVGGYPIRNGQLIVDETKR